MRRSTFSVIVGLILWTLIAGRVAVAADRPPNVVIIFGSSGNIGGLI